MALFTDGLVSGIEDLAAQDSQVLDVASTEGINLTHKLTAAQDDVAIELTVLVSKLSGADRPFWAARRPTLDNVVVTPALKLWHIYLTLEMVYRDAYNSQLNDRYAGKRDQFHELAQWACEKLIQTGVGLAAQPVAQALTPTVRTLAGTLADGTYYVGMAWVNALGEEGAGAVPAAITISASALEVEPGATCANATGWNVYIGSEPEAMVAQNQTVLGIGATWQQTAPPATSGRGPGNGQEPTYFKPLPRVLQRG
jgi:hypothetical protein